MSMNFFGLTSLGDNEPWKTNHVRALNVLSFTDEEFAAAFRFIDSDDKGSIEPFEIRALLSRAYGDTPAESEVSEFLEDFELLPFHDRHLDLALVLASIDRMRGRARAREEAKATPEMEFKSYAGYTDARHKHARLHHTPQERFRAPPTSNNEYGWYTPTDVERTNRMARQHCDEVNYQEVAVMNEKLG